MGSHRSCPRAPVAGPTGHEGDHSRSARGDRRSRIGPGAEQLRRCRAIRRRCGRLRPARDLGRRRILGPLRRRRGRRRRDRLRRARRNGRRCGHGRRGRLGGRRRRRGRRDSRCGSRRGHLGLGRIDDNAGGTLLLLAGEAHGDPRERRQPRLTPHQSQAGEGSQHDEAGKHEGLGPARSAASRDRPGPQLTRLGPSPRREPLRHRDVLRRKWRLNLRRKWRLKWLSALVTEVLKLGIVTVALDAAHHGKIPQP
jgi:hypothetical protein